MDVPKYDRYFFVRDGKLHDMCSTSNIEIGFVKLNGALFIKFWDVG